MFERLAAFQKRTTRSWKQKALNYLNARTAVLLVVATLAGCSTSELQSDRGPSPELTPEQELETFQIEPGLKVQLVAAEPLVEDPVVCTFDEDGRLWVVEMRSYMPDIDGEGERQPTGRVSVLEDTDGDGEMDDSKVYLDSLVLPRALAIVKGGVLVVENEALWMTKDTDGDFRADSKVLIDADYAGSSLPEHSGNGLWRGIDNWYYNAKSRLRYRLTDGKWIRDSTEFRGQWGISHDDAGRLYYNYNWSQLHADLVPPNYLTRNKNHTPVTGIDVGLTLEKRVYPIRPTPAVNRGYIPGILDEESKLKEFTAACSPFVYRGTALPQQFYGNVLVCEPSGNLVKRDVIESNGLLLKAHDPHPGREFLASTDERFRPVHFAQGPDGALYLADMYRGLIQHKAYVTPYLRDQTLSRKLVLPIHRGRIWKIVPENWELKKPLKLSKMSASELVERLASADGWQRDMAQRLLVERGDESSVQPLREMALHGKNAIGRFHALWTLEGLGSLTSEILFSLTSDAEPLVASTAVRLLEPMAKKDKEVRDKLQHVLLDQFGHASIQQVLQSALTAAVLDEQAAHNLLLRIATQYDTAALIRDAILSSLPNTEFAFMQKLLAAPQWKEQTQSHEIFLETLTSAIVRKRNPRELKSLLGMLDVDRNAFGWQERIILTGMSIQGYGGKVKPVTLASQPSVLKRKDLAIIPSQLEGLASLFQWPGSVARDTTKVKGIVLNEQEKEQFVLGRKFYLSTCSGCHGSDGGGLNRFAPPLRGSEWVVGDQNRLALIVLHGIEGPLQVAGKRYAEPEILPVMPGHSTLDDETLSAILTYIRNEWGNQAGAISRRALGSIRMTNQGRVLPWTAETLEKHMEEVSH